MAKQSSPIAVYELKASIEDKGIGYSVKQAVTSYITQMSQKGVTLRCGEFRATSRNLRLTLEVMPGGEDLTLQHFRKFIENSGRLPAQAKARPTFVFRGIPLEECAAAKTRELETRVKELEAKEIELRTEGNELRKALSKRKTKLEEAQTENETLRDKISKSPGEKYDSPRKAILFGYLQHQSDELLEAYLHATDLQANNDFEIFINHSEPFLTFAQYLTEHTGKDYEEKEIEELLAEIGKTNNWKDTKKGQELIQEKEQTQKDLTIYATAEKAGASKEVLDAIKVALKGMSISAVEQKIQEYKQEFEELKNNYQEIMSYKESYSNLKNMIAQSRRRVEKGTRIPISIMTQGQELGVFIPTFSSENVIYKHLRKVIYRIAEEEGMEMAERMHQGDIMELYGRANSEESETKIGKIADNITERIKSEKILEAFGVAPAICTLHEY